MLGHAILPGLSASSPEHTVSVKHPQTAFHPDDLPDHSHDHLEGVNFEQSIQWIKKIDKLISRRTPISMIWMH